MPLSLNEIKALDTIDLEDFEIRGIRFNSENARSTGPVFSRGTYEPSRTLLYGSGIFSTDSSFVTDISFDAPFSGFDASVLKSGDSYITDASTFTIQGQLDSTSIIIDRNSGLSGIIDSTASLISRDYLIEPDTSANNLTQGQASFTKDSTLVSGIGTNWDSEIDFIRSTPYQVYYVINSVNVGAQEINLAIPYAGDTTTTTYIAKKSVISHMKTRYTKNNFEYDKQTGRWASTDGTTDSNKIISTDWLPYIDGVELKFTNSLSENDPDLMDTDVVLNKTLVESTQRELFQFPLPKVPFPESSMQLRINDEVVDRFPDGNKNYVINYHQDPIYLSPPPLGDRRVANLMFLDSVSNLSLNPILTAEGIVSFTDESGNQIGGIMPGSETVVIDGTQLQRYVDYNVDTASGTVNVASAREDETVVKYISSTYGDLIDYGIEFTLNGVKLQYSIPPQDTDDVLFQTGTGVMRPSDKAHPGPGEEYIIDYFVEANLISDEIKTISAGQTVVRSNIYPVKTDSMIVLKNGNILTEGTDFRVNYFAGKVTLYQPLVLTDEINLTYTPLSKQRNGISYANGDTTCTVYDARLIIIDSNTYSFRLQNLALDPATTNIHRIYNDTRNKDYNLAGLIVENPLIQLAQDSTNTSIGLSASDAVVIDYSFKSRSVEYFPVTTINFTFFEDSSSVFFYGQDKTSLFAPGTGIRMNPADEEGDYLFTVSSSSFDGEDTQVILEGTSPYDLINPGIGVTDASVNYSTAPLKAFDVITSSNQVQFLGDDISDLFRPNAAMKIGADSFLIRNAEYDVAGQITTVTLATTVFQDYTSVNDLSNIRYSDSPLYNEGDTEIFPIHSVVTEPAQVAMQIVYSGTGIVYASSDASFMYINTDDSRYVFEYSLYPTISDLSGGLVSSVPNIGVQKYVDTWSSTKIISVTDIPLSVDSTQEISVNPDLFLDGTRVTDYEITTTGTIELSSGLSPNQRYTFYYQGREYLGSSQVVFSGSYFTSLPAGSKLSASFEFENLDQFYLQAVGQRWFLENIIQPRMEEEARQQQGNVGQGGIVLGDEDFENWEVGVTGDEYRRQDTEIECRVFDEVFDLFNDRLSAYGSEMYAGIGWKLCNNDGTLSEQDQLGGVEFYNRMWPIADYTNFEPLMIPPLSGQTEPSGRATFNGTSVSGSGTAWQYQKLEPGDFIRPSDSSMDYEIQSVNSNTSITLVGTGYPGILSNSSFVITSKFPLYDDDGHMGGKLVGTQTGRGLLDNGDVFTAYVDGVPSSYTFVDGAKFDKDVDRLTLSQVAEVLDGEITGISAEVEYRFDPTYPLGKRDVIVVRTSGLNNCLALSNTSAVTKLGFTPDITSCGNLDRTGHYPEVIWHLDEQGHLSTEDGFITNLITAGSTNKLDRIDTGIIPNAVSAYNEINSENIAIANQLLKLNDETTALNYLLEERDWKGIDPPSYTDNLVALADASQYVTDTLLAEDYNDRILLDWDGKGDASKWVLDWDSTRQDIYGKNGSIGIDVPTPTPISGQSTFILQVDIANDRRILDSTNVDGTHVDAMTYIGYTYQTPRGYYIDDDSTAWGTWTGWDPSVSDEYSINNQVTFTIASINLFDITPPGAGWTYIVDSTSLNISNGITNYQLLYGSFPTVSSMKTEINTNIPGVTASGSVSYDSCNSTLLISSGALAGSTPVYQGLRPLYVTYQTISDRILADRSDYIDDRDATVSDRYDYLINTREDAIKDAVVEEELLRALDQTTVEDTWGNIYVWANNRFNRGYGCEARLMQIEKQIERNNSALNISKKFL